MVFYRTPAARHMAQPARTPHVHPHGMRAPNSANRTKPGPPRASVCGWQDLGWAREAGGRSPAISVKYRRRERGSAVSEIRLPLAQPFNQRIAHARPSLRCVFWLVADERTSRFPERPVRLQLLAEAHQRFPPRVRQGRKSGEHSRGGVTPASSGARRAAAAGRAALVAGLGVFCTSLGQGRGVVEAGEDEVAHLGDRVSPATWRVDFAIGVAAGCVAVVDSVAVEAGDAQGCCHVGRGAALACESPW
jgi:hypothetical protein